MKFYINRYSTILVHLCSTFSDGKKEEFAASFWHYPSNQGYADSHFFSLKLEKRTKHGTLMDFVDFAKRSRIPNKLSSIAKEHSTNQ